MYGVVRVAACAASPNDSAAATPAPPKEQPEQPRRRRKPMSEETKLKISLAKKGVPRPEEVRRKISEAHLGVPRPEETRRKISQSNKDKPKSLSHRFNIAMGRIGVRHSADTKRKIAAAEKATKQRLRRQRLAARAEAAAEAATADLRIAFSTTDSNAYSKGESAGYTNAKDKDFYATDSDVEADDAVQDNPDNLLNELELEKAVIEVTALRRSLTAWMDAYEAKYGRKPNLTEASETNPQVYGRFVRYVALRELVRRSSLAIGQTPVLWD